MGAHQTLRMFHDFCFKTSLRPRRFTDASSEPWLAQPFRPLRASACSWATLSVSGRMELHKSVYIMFLKYHASHGLSGSSS